MKTDELAKRYAEETRMFQRTVGIPETPTDELIIFILSQKVSRRARMLQSIEEHNIIAKMASQSRKT